MLVPLMAMVGLGICVAFLAIAFWYTQVGRRTCGECGGTLPVIRLASRSQGSASGDWACPKCGTRFDRHGRVRQFPT